LQDDYLDAFGDPKVFGKQLGGDILSGKKTYLFISAKEQGTTQQCQKLLDLFEQQDLEPKEKVKQVKILFEATGATTVIQKAIQKYTDLAFAQLNQTDLSDQAKAYMTNFGRALMNRKF
jgi:geranylgeranyl diphosphate synthase type II